MMAMPPPLNKLSKPTFEQLLAASEIPYDKQKLETLSQKNYIRFDDQSSVYKITRRRAGEQQHLQDHRRLARVRFER